MVAQDFIEEAAWHRSTLQTIRNPKLKNGKHYCRLGVFPLQPRPRAFFECMLQIASSRARATFRWPSQRQPKHNTRGRLQLHLRNAAQHASHNEASLSQCLHQAKYRASIRTRVFPMHVRASKRTRGKLSMSCSAPQSARRLPK